MILGIFPVQWLEQHNFGKIAQALVVLVLIAGVFCVLAGVHLAVGWEDPLAHADPEAIGRASGHHGRRAGLFVLAIRFWPYVLIGLGGYMVYHVALGICKSR
jgi:hypothetical protein